VAQVTTWVCDRCLRRADPTPPAIDFSIPLIIDKLPGRRTHLELCEDCWADLALWIECHEVGPDES
jgi:hypothetical protein